MNKRLLLIINDNNEIVTSANKTHYIFIDKIHKIKTDESMLIYPVYFLIINEETISFTSKNERNDMLKKVLKTIKSHFKIVELNKEKFE